MEKEKKLESLATRIYELEEQNEKNKTKRNITYIMVISLIFFCMMFDKIENIEGFLLSILFSVLGGAFYFFINICVFSSYFYANENENRMLDELKEKYRNLNKY